MSVSALFPALALALASAQTYPPPFPREGAKKLAENEDKDVVVVFIEAGKLRSTPQNGEPTLSPVGFGEVRFNPRNRAHSEETVEGTPRAIIIELK
jgi:hypothetical protein